jgi:hypothetical protein
MLKRGTINVLADTCVLLVQLVQHHWALTREAMYAQQADTVLLEPQLSLHAHQGHITLTKRNQCASQWPLVSTQTRLTQLQH